MDLTKLNEYFALHPSRRINMVLFLNTLVQNPEALNNLVNSSMFFVGKHNIHDCFSSKNTRNPGHEHCEDEDVYSADTEFEADNEIAKAIHNVLKLNPIKSFYEDGSSEEGEEGEDE